MWFLSGCLYSAVSLTRVRNGPSYEQYIINTHTNTRARTQASTHARTHDVKRLLHENLNVSLYTISSTSQYQDGKTPGQVLANLFSLKEPLEVSSWLISPKQSFNFLIAAGFPNACALTASFQIRRAFAS